MPIKNMEYLRASTVRKTNHQIDKTFIDRWSPRALSGENITDEELFTLFEAARWAPSCFNEQPWRFVYIKRDSSNWNRSLDILSATNQLWCKNAAVLICLISKKNFSHNNSPNKNHLSDAGAAWENLALQATINGIVAHSMVGFNPEKARSLFEIPEEYDIVQMIAIGKPADKTVLSEQLQERESPSNRKPLQDLIFEEKFKKTI